MSEIKTAQGYAAHRDNVHHLGEMALGLQAVFAQAALCWHHLEAENTTIEKVQHAAVQVKEIKKLFGKMQSDNRKLKLWADVVQTNESGRIINAASQMIACAGMVQNDIEKLITKRMRAALEID